MYYIYTWHKLTIFNHFYVFSSADLNTFTWLYRSHY
jgi:hypothetical protein